MRYALRNALAPSVQVLRAEPAVADRRHHHHRVLFAYPGIGSGLVDRGRHRDVTLVQSVAMLIAVFYMLRQHRGRPDRAAAGAEAAGPRMTRPPPLRPRPFSGALGAGRSLVVARAGLRSSGRTSRRTIPTQPIGSPLTGAERRCLAGHRLPRPRRAQPRCSTAGASVLGAGAGRRRCSPTSIGLAIGLIAGYTRSLADPLLMRAVDVMLLPAAALPARAGHRRRHGHRRAGDRRGRDPDAGHRRIVRTATLEMSVRGYVEAAVARGERTHRGGRPRGAAEHPRADAGRRRACASRYSILIIASVNFLGLGLQPPSSDWALMISENRQYISLNPWAVLAPAAMIALLTIGVNLDRRRDRPQPGPIVRAQGDAERADMSATAAAAR